MDNQKYVLRKLEEAKQNILKTLGPRNSYSKSDVFKMLTKFGYVESLALDEAPMYLPSKGYCFDSISEFTNSFIQNNSNYQIYAIRMEHHFNLFVVSYKQNIANAYYSVNISLETMDICYILEVMTNRDL